MPSLFPTAVYRERLEKVRELCTHHGLGGVIIGTGPELAYLCGSWASTHERLTALIIPTHGQMVFLLPGVDAGELQHSAVPQLDIQVRGWVDGEDPHQLAADALAGNAPIGLGSDLSATHVLRLQELLAPRTTVLAARTLAEVFMSKDAAEIEQLSAAGAAIDRVHQQVPALLQPGRTEAEVAADIDALIREEHDGGVDFIIVGSGPNGALPHHSFSDRRLTPGDPVVVDLGGSLGPGYHSDCTRTYLVEGAAPHPDFLALYEVLYAAQEAAVQAIRPGVSAAFIDQVARDHISAAGYGDYFIHRTGHGIGLSLHEEPFIMAGNSLNLQEGMCFSVEPGIYLPGRFGARIEDIVSVTADGVRRLNHCPRELNHHA